MIDAAAMRDLVEEIIEEWEGADGSLDQEFLVGQEEHAKADARRARRRKRSGERGWKKSSARHRKEGKMSALILHHPRWLQRLRAGLMGRFWLPCPRCGRMFGGQEWHHPHQVIAVPGEPASRGQGVCPWCASSPETLAWERQAGLHQRGGVEDFPHH